MQLEEKRRHIEEEKSKMIEKWNADRQKMGQTAFWFVVGGKELEELESERVAREKEEIARKKEAARRSNNSSAWEISFDDKESSPVSFTIIQCCVYSQTIVSRYFILK